MAVQQVGDLNADTDTGPAPMTPLIAQRRSQGVVDARRISADAVRCIALDSSVESSNWHRRWPGGSVVFQGLLINRGQLEHSTVRQLSRMTQPNASARPIARSEWPHQDVESGA